MKSNKLIAAVLSIVMIISLFSFPVNIFAAEEKGEEEYLILDTSNKNNITKTFAKATVDTKFVKTNKYSAKLDLGEIDDATTRNFPTDLTPYNEMKMTVYASGKATMYMYFITDNTDTDGMDYYGKSVSFEEGWQEISIEIPSMSRTRWPSFKKAETLAFNFGGWGQNKNAEAQLYFDKISLTHNPKYAETIDIIPTPTPTPTNEPETEAGNMRYVDNDFELEGSELGINAKKNEWLRVKDGNNTYLMIKKADVEDAHYDKKIISSSRYSVISADFASTQFPKGTQLITCKSKTAQYIFVSMASDGTLSAGRKTIGKMKPDGKFMNIAVACDFINNKYKVYIDGKVVAENLNIGETLFGYPTLFRTHVSAGEDNGANIMIDNLRMFDGKTPDDYKSTITVDEAEELAFKNVFGKPSPLIKVGTATIEKIDEVKAVAINVHSGYIHANGMRSLPDVAPYIKSGRTLLPVRAISETLGCEVSWDDATKTATINGKAKIVIGSDKMVLPDGSTYTLDVPAEITNSRTFIPLRALCEQVLGKTVFWNDRGLIVLSDEEIELTESEITELNNYMLYQRPAADELKKMFEQSNNVHPRVIANAEKFEQIISAYKTDEIMKEWGDSVIASAEKYLSAAHGKYSLSGNPLSMLAISRDVLEKSLALSMAYKLTGEKKYVDYLWEEIQKAGSFPDWNHLNHFLDTAEMTTAFAIAYDWLYDLWSDEQKKFMEEAMYKHGLQRMNKAQYGHGDYPNFFITANSNWNAVCNGGIGIGAIAVFDKYPELCGDILEKNFASIEVMLSEFYPDGSWYEGPGYWGYLTKYLSYFTATCENTFNTDFNLTKAPGIEKSAEYLLSCDGMTGANNFHDAGAERLMSDFLFWHSEKFGNQGIAAVNLLKKFKYDSPGTVNSMLFYNTDVKPAASITLPLDSAFRGTEIVNLRSSWANDSGIYASLHTGKNLVNHAHLDAGTFVIDIGGQRFASDSGSEDYNIDGYFGDKRYLYYRTRPEGHNTIVINPDGSLGQDLEGHDVIAKLESKPRGSFAIAPMSSSYKSYAESVERGMMLGDDRRSVLIRDEIRGMKKEVNEVYWFMQLNKVEAKVIDKNTAILSKGGVDVKFQVLTDADDCEITLGEAVVLPTSPNLPNQIRNVGWQRLAVKLTAGKDVNVSVKMSLLDDPIGDTPIKDVALKDWAIEDGELPQWPMIDMIYADGVPLSGYNKESLAYSMVVTQDTVEFPNFTYDVSDKYDVEITNPAGFNKGVTEIKVTDKADPRYTQTYKISYKVVANPINIDDLQKYEIKEFVPSAVPQPENAAANAFDNNIETRWAVDGANQWIKIDLGEVKPIEAIGVMVWKSTERDTLYGIEVSEDGENWIEVFDGQSSGTADNKFDFYSAYGESARYIKINCHGTNTGLWTSILELAVFGKKQ